MSRIFDALQRAESETGNGESTFSVATELLRAAEEKMRLGNTIEERPARVESVETAQPASSDFLEQCPVMPVFIPQESRLVAVGKEGSLGAEKFRFLAVRLRQLRQSRPLKKILITSTSPQQG